jgi:Tfp pilus assembly protein PilN
MLRINLLPESARKAALSPIEQFHRTPLMWIVLGMMILLLVSLGVPIPIRRQRLQQINAKIQALEPKKLEVDRLQQSVQELRAQEAAFQGIGKGRRLWSKRLNTLSDVTPEGVWFTDLAFDQVKGLVIQGSVIGEGGSEMVGVGRLVQDLKADADFASAIKDIQIESIKRVQDRETEIVQFTLLCGLLEAPTP